MSRDIERSLSDGLRVLGFAAPEALATRLLDYGALLLEENCRTNLISAKSLESLVAPHFLDSLAAAAKLRLASPVIDIGSGAGLPGIPIALAYPDIQVVLFEPRRKRAEFLRRAVAALGLSTVVVEQITAETAGRGVWRGKAGSAVARALGSVAVALELGIPLLRRGGRLLLYMGRRGEPDTDEVRVARLLGADIERAEAVQVPGLRAVRHVLIFRKSGDTAAEYPRRSGVPGKEPLGRE